MSDGRSSRFNSGQASRIRVYASQLLAIDERLDDWWYHGEAAKEVEGWDRSVLRRLNRSSILENRQAGNGDQYEWHIPSGVIDYIEEKGYGRGYNQ